MAAYKVPQDVEAEDKLIGPFSFRQFGYLFGVAIGGFILFLLYTKAPLFIAGGMTIILLPPMGALLAISLPLKKDQPMEMYLLAMVRFFFKPRLRMWAPDGQASLVEITAPQVVEQPRTKAFSGQEADSQLAYLASLMDSRGWSAKGVGLAPAPTIAISDDTEDVLDDSTNISRSFDKMLSDNDSRHHQELVAKMHQQNTPAAAVTKTVTQPPEPTTAPTTTMPDKPVTAQAAPMQAQPTIQAADDTDVSTPKFDPYPTMHQHVLSPNASSVPKKAPKPATNNNDQNASAKTVSPDIIRLAENKDLSISAIAHEASRLKDQADGEEVVISLR